MRKFTTFLAVATLVASSATANAEGRSIMVDNGFRAPTPLHKARRLAAPLREGAIIETPAGTVKAMTRNSTVYTNFWDEVESSTESGIITEFVEGEDGYIYWNSPVSSYITSTYLKGKLQDGTLSFILPQNMGEFEEYDYWNDEMVISTYFASLVEPDGEEWVKVCADQTLKLGLKDGIYTQEGTSILGIMKDDPEDADAWTGNGENDIAIEEMNDKTIQLPGGLEVQRWAMYFEEGELATQAQQFVQVAVGADKVYVGGLYDNLPEAWVVGNIVEGNKLTIPSGQYLGEDLQNGRYAFLIGASYSIDQETQDVYLQPQNQIQLSFDTETMEIKADQATALMIGTTYNAHTANLLKLILSPMARYEGEMAPAMPQNPEIVGAAQYDVDETPWDYGYIRFNIFPLSTEGKLIDASLITYNIFMDDDLYEVDPETYGVPEAMTDIPYDFNDYYGDIQAYNNGYHAFYYQIPYLNRIGVRVNYTVGDVTNSTPVVYYDFSGVGVEQNFAEDAQPVSTTYYDLMGREIQEPSHGIVIVKTLRADGSVTCQKRAIR